MQNEALIVAHVGFARALARGVTCLDSERADLESEAMLALITVGASFDTSRGRKFSTFVYPRVTGSLRDWLTSCRRRYGMDRTGTNNHLPAQLHDMNGRPLVSIDDWKVGAEQETLSGSVGIAHQIHEALDSIPKRERRVIVLRFWECMSHEEIGAVLGVSYGRAWQLEQQGIKRLRAHFEALGLTLEAFL